MSGTITATFPVRPVMRPRAARFGTKPSSRTAASTRRRVSGATFSGTLMVRDTVAACTPARAATSRIVARCSRRTTPDPTRRPVAAEGTDDSRSNGNGCAAARCTEAQADALPDYDRSRAPCITHLGFGAFARAHLAVYADDAAAPGPARADQGRLHQESGGRRTNSSHRTGSSPSPCGSPARTPSLEVIGALASMETGAAAALDAMTAPTTRLVTLTITEKGYEPSLDTPRPSKAHGDHARAHRLGPGPVPAGRIGPSGLRSARQPPRQRQPSCAHASSRPPSASTPSLAPWIADKVLFPSSVVDRMVPAPTERDVEDIADRLGLARPGCSQHGATPLLDHASRSPDWLHWATSASGSSTT